MLIYIKCTVIILFLLMGCSTSRIRYKPGEIPSLREVSVEDERYGNQVMEQLTQQYPLDRDDANNIRVNKIVERLAKSLGNSNQPWHVYVLKGDTVKNAGATKGNFIFVWTGMLRSIQNDDELAGILAHEIGHILAQHTVPTPDEQARTLMTGAAGTITREILMRQGIGGGLLGSQLGEALITQSMQAFLINPESQRKEYEADQIGLFLMKDAGYDPRKAIDFWERASKDKNFSTSVPEFLSTHPSTEKRLVRLHQLLPMVENSSRSFRLGSRDSFAVNNTPPQGIKSSGIFSSRSKHNNKINSQGSFYSRNRQKSSIINVYEQKSNNSHIIEKLRESEIHDFECVSYDWIKVFAPVKGFIAKREVFNTGFFRKCF